MEIKVIGENSSNRIKLLKNINKALKNLDGHFEIILLEDKKYEDKYRVTNTPSLVINNKLVSEGKVLTDREIINYVKVLS